jgi:hypothetical protein
MGPRQGVFGTYTPRAGDRLRVDFDAFLTPGGGQEVPIIVRDFSSHGFRFACSEPLPIGSEVSLRTLDFGPFSATIAWQLGVNAGARFAVPLSMHTVMSIILAVMQLQVPNKGD